MSELTLGSIKAALGNFWNVADAQSLGPDGLNLTIKDLRIAPVGETKEEKPVLSFAESRKGLVLSKGRIEQLEGLFGNATPAILLGKRVNLYVRAGRRGPECALRAATA